MTMRFDRDTREMYGTEFYRTFDDKNPNWDSRHEYNEMFVQVQLNYFTNRLSARGYLFLNEFYEGLGFPPVPQGQLIGWFYADGRRLVPRVRKNNDGSITIELNVTASDVMYFKI